MPPPGWQPPQGPPPGWQPPPGPPPQQGWPPQGYPPPHGYPPPQQGWPPHYPPPQQGWPPPKPPANNRGLVIGLVVAAAVIGLVVVMAVVVIRFGGDDPGDVTDEERAANPTTAALSSDLGVVCDRGSVSNAAPYRKPYTIVAFHQTQADGFSGVSFTGEQDFSPVGKDPESVNVVACLYRKDGTEKKVGTCEFEDNDVVDHYAVEYDLEVREAKTGKSIENLGTVRGPAGDCPFIVYFGSGERRIYGDPDAIAVKAKLSEFAAR